MIPYADFLYFGLLLYPVLPTVVLGLAGFEGKRWALFVTIAMLAIQYSAPIGLPGAGTGAGPSTGAAPDRGISSTLASGEFWLVIGFGLVEWAVASAFARIRSRTDRRWPYWLALVLSLSPLAAVKFLPLVAPGQIIGFLGISYVTFRALDVVFLIEDRLISSLPPARYLAYLLFFPTISSGPIDRYRRFEADWDRRRGRAEFLDDLDAAVHRTFTGFLYKFILAALVRRYWLDPAAAGEGPLAPISYMYAYTFYLFFDFAGYSSFAIGLSRVFGVHTPENFDAPFLARDIRDFWNRWHISLSHWFRDHVYMRFVLAATKGRWFRGRYTASILGLFVTFGLMGLWHGVEWNYLAYGFYHAALLSGFEAFSRWNKRRKVWGAGPFWRAFGTLLTFHAVCFGFLLFSGRLAAPSQPAKLAADTALRSLATPSFEGTMDSATCGHVTGWAWDRNRPDETISVEIYEGDNLLVLLPANLKRKDLLDAGKGDGQHGFEFPLPVTLRDGKPHLIRVRYPGTHRDLYKSPQMIVCAGG